MRADSPLHWIEICMQALEESDPEKLRRLVPEAEQAIFLRREALGTSAEVCEELSTMAVVAEALRAIRVHQLDRADAARSTQSDSGTPAL
jgi:hypothetical protein